MRGADFVGPPVEAQAATVESLKAASIMKSGHLAIAVGRGRHGEIAASGIVKECGGRWRSWAGGLIDRRILLEIGGCIACLQGFLRHLVYLIRLLNDSDCAYYTTGLPTEIPSSRVQAQS